MADIIPFFSAIQRMRDWTPSERERLQEVARTLASDESPIRVEFGTADDGNPWCVILDDTQDTLVHAARINGRFIIHRVADDVIEEGANLQSVIDAALGLRWDDARDDVVVSFNTARRVQTIAALIVVTAFYETTGEAAVIPDVPNEAEAERKTVSEAVPLPDPAYVANDDPPLFAPRELGAHRSANMAATAEWLLAAAPEMAQNSAAQIIPAGYSVATPASPPSLMDGAPFDLAGLLTPETGDFEQVLSGTAGNDRLTGGNGRDLLDGGAGDDILIGGGGSDMLLGGAGDDILVGGSQADGIDFLDGGTGSDRLYLAAGTIGIGGADGDMFTVLAPVAGSKSDQPLAVIVDFRASEGDSIVLLQAITATVVNVTPKDNILDGLLAPPSASLAPPSPVSGERLGIDTTGDGKEDSFILINGTGNAAAISAPSTSTQPNTSGEPPLPVWPGIKAGTGDAELLDWVPDAAPLI